MVTFSFRCTRPAEDRAITNALLLYRSPRQANLVFAFDYKSVGVVAGQEWAGISGYGSQFVEMC